MADPVRFCGFNRRLVPAPGTEDRVGTLYVHTNGRENISCWKLTPDELAHVVKTGEIWQSVAPGDNAPHPCFITGFPLMEVRDFDTGELTTYHSDGSHVVNDARQFAILHHGDQNYGEGMPYSYHLGKVVEVLEDFQADWAFKAAAWLHDVAEDTMLELPMDARMKIIGDRYGQTIHNLVWACTGQMHIDGVKQNRKARNAEQYAKIAAFPPAAAVKIADRIANMEACALFKSTLGPMYLAEVEDFDANVGAHCPPEMRARLHAAADAISQYVNVEKESA